MIHFVRDHFLRREKNNVLYINDNAIYDNKIICTYYLYYVKRDTQKHEKHKYRCNPLKWCAGIECLFIYGQDRGRGPSLRGYHRGEPDQGSGDGLTVLAALRHRGARCEQFTVSRARFTVRRRPSTIVLHANFNIFFYLTKIKKKIRIKHNITTSRPWYRYMKFLKKNVYRMRL